MKKIIAAVLLSVLALSGCNEKGDNGELAGVYQAENKDQMILSFSEKDKQYKVDYRQYVDLSSVNKYAKPQYKNVSLVGYVVRDGDFLMAATDNDKKMFKIENDNLKAVYNNLDATYSKSK